jgi:multidrug resistance protein MdtO
MCLLQDFAPNTDFDKIRDRVVGILFGIGVTTLAYRYLWPQRDPR